MRGKVKKITNLKEISPKSQLNKKILKNYKIQTFEFSFQFLRWSWSEVGSKTIKIRTFGHFSRFEQKNRTYTETIFADLVFFAGIGQYDVTPLTAESVTGKDLILETKRLNKSSVLPKQLVQDESRVAADEAVPADVGRLLQDEQPLLGVRAAGGEREAERIQRRLPHQL